MAKTLNYKKDKKDTPIICCVLFILINTACNKCRAAQHTGHVCPFISFVYLLNY
jgi:hypothetical protein